MPLLLEEIFLLTNALLNGGAFVMLRKTVKELRAIYNMQRRIERQGE